MSKKLIKKRRPNDGNGGRGIVNGRHRGLNTYELRNMPISHNLYLTLWNRFIVWLKNKLNLAL